VTVDKPLPDDFDPYGGRNVRIIRNERDWLAIAVAVVTLVTNIGLWVWWAAKLDAIATNHENRIEGIEQRERGSTVSNSARDVSMAVMTSQLEQIKDTVNRIENRMENKK
jgi:hypothetical protein